jgi:hypothetical protein
MYPESKAFKSTRPSGSGDLAQPSTGHSDSGFALEQFSYLCGVFRAVKGGFYFHPADKDPSAGTPDEEKAT